MLLPTWVKVDWRKIRTRRLLNVQRDNDRENARRKLYTYQPGDSVLLANDSERIGKMEPRWFGPFVIVTVNSNGTLLIQRGTYQETVNVRRIKPYHAPLPIA
jgi:ribosomal protein L21E